MHTSAVDCPGTTNWRSLYRAAILETQRPAIPQRISEAEKAVLTRGHEVFYGGAFPGEMGDLADALYLLRVLRTACEQSASKCTFRAVDGGSPDFFAASRK
jgi:hypothetical protein